MKVKDLIKQLEELNKPDAEITLLGNVGHPEDEETDLYFDLVEIWNDGEDSITLFIGLSDETLEQIESQKPLRLSDLNSNDDIDDEDYKSGLLYQNQKSVFEFGNEYQCTQFFCSDRNVVGVDVSLNNEHLGEIIGIHIPDIDDEEENIKFDNEVINWIVDNNH
jgi:hypothetical protein